MQIIAEIERQKASQNGKAVAVKMSPQTWVNAKDELWRTYHINITSMRISGLDVIPDLSIKDGEVRVLNFW